MRSNKRKPDKERKSLKHEYQSILVWLAIGFGILLMLASLKMLFSLLF